MVFGDSYLKADKITFYRWTIAATVILILSVLLIQLKSCGKPISKEETEEKISKSANLTRIDKLCNELPKPKDFQFIEKTISGNSFTLSVSFDYYSREQPEEVRSFYSKFLEANGWAIGESDRYEKGNQQISISAGNFQKANYSIYCAEVD